MKFKVGDVVLDIRDQELAEIVRIQPSNIVLKVIRPGNGSEAMMVFDEGYEYSTPPFSMDKHRILCESTRVELILKRYED
jgi:hypothetical protein